MKFDLFSKKTNRALLVLAMIDLSVSTAFSANFVEISVSEMQVDSTPKPAKPPIRYAPMPCSDTNQVQTDPRPAEEPQKPGEEILTYVERMPQFPGGESALLDFLEKNIQYPAAARDAGIQGRVFLSFVVEKNGTLTQLKIVKDIGGGCGEEALRVFLKMPKWNPAWSSVDFHRVRMNFPVMFKPK